MSEKKNNGSNQLERRMRQIEMLEEKFGVQNLTAIIDTLTSNPEIPVSEMSTNLRSAVVLALLTESASDKRPAAVCELIDFLLNQRRKSLGLPVKEEEKEPSPVSRVIRDAKKGVRQLDSNVSEIGGGDWLTLDDEEWPGVKGNS